MILGFRRAVLLSCLSLVALLALRSETAAITRQEVMVCAKAFASHPWRCENENLTASCSTAYQSPFPVGDYIGVAYDWGGGSSLFEFDQGLSQGLGAGDHMTSQYDLPCTVGVDCSGYVSVCWDLGYKAGTSTLSTESTVINQADILPGDVFNDPGNHVVFYSHTLSNGDPVFYEAGAYVVEVSSYGGWSKVSGFTPMRYKLIEDSVVGDPPGTTENPIVISSFPFSDSGDTSTAASNVLDGCAADPSKDEGGPEVIYQASFSTPGTLTVTVSSSPADIDVHLYSSMNTNDCLARDDKSFSYQVDCGTYYIVADTFKDKAGSYDLYADFVPSTQACGSGPEGYEPTTGRLGDKCTSSFLYCNENLGGQICITTSIFNGFCSRSCTSDSDCAAIAGGCCHLFNFNDGSSGQFCALPSYCSTPQPDAGAPDSAVPDAALQPDSAGSDDLSPPSPDSQVSTGDSAGHREQPAADGAIEPEPSPEDEGCACGLSPSSPGGPAAQLLLSLALLALQLRRRGGGSRRRKEAR